MDTACREHPNAESLSAYGLGKLDEANTATVYHHLEECAECRSRVETLPDDTLALQVRASATPLDVTRAFDPGEGAGVPLLAPAASVPAALADHPRYRVLELLGRGGMGAVYRVEHRLMERTVALKIINRELTDRPAVVERFHREVKAAARLDHPNIVRAHDAEHAGATHFLVMECVEGKTLAGLVAERGPLPVAEACDYIGQAALGLQHAFEHGMVHRDIKPHNLMVTPAGVVKVLDFGLARLASELPAAAGATSSGMMVGTADYIAPEQASEPHAADIRADIYALGCTLHFLLTGQPPYPEGTLMQKLLAHSSRTPRPVTDFRTDIPPGLAHVIARMTTKDPAGRYQTPAEVARALAPFGARAPAKGETLDPAAARRRRWWPAAAVAMALLAVGVGLLALVVYHVQTDQGEFVVEVDDEQVEVLLAKHGLTVKDLKSGRTYLLRPGHHDLAAGRYEIDVTEAASGLQFSTRQFNIVRGGEERVKVSLKRAAQERQPPVAKVRWLEGYVDVVWSVAFSPDGQHTLTTGGLNQLCERATGKQVRRFGNGGWYAVFSPKGDQVLSGEETAQLAVLWDTATGKEIKRFGDVLGRSCFGTFSPDGRVIAVNHWDTVRIYEVASGKELAVLPSHTQCRRGAVFTPDGKRLLVAQVDKAIFVFETAAWKEVARWALPTDVGWLAVSPDGSTLLATPQGLQFSDVLVWDVATGREKGRLRGAAVKPDGGTEGTVNTVAFAPDGRRALYAGWDGLLILWDVTAGKEIQRWQRDDKIESVAISPDGTEALCGTADKKAFLFRLPDPPPPAKEQTVGELRRGCDKNRHLWALAGGKEVHCFNRHIDLLSVDCAPRPRNQVDRNVNQTQLPPLTHDPLDLLLGSAVKEQLLDDGLA